MANTVSVKVFIEDGSNHPEIRRFEVDQAVITNYDYLRERLQMIIPRLRGKYFRLLWKDVDGDEISISSDDELMIALTEVASGIVKFIVRFDGNVENSRDDQCPIETLEFPNLLMMANVCPAFDENRDALKCSVCMKVINGVRYKCIECIQFNLCPECEQKNEHPEHVMLRLQKSMSLFSVLNKGNQILKKHLFEASKRFGERSFHHGKSDHCSHSKEKCWRDRRRHNMNSFRGCSRKYSEPGCSADNHLGNIITGNIQTFINSLMDAFATQKPETFLDTETTKEPMDIPSNDEKNTANNAQATTSENKSSVNSETSSSSQQDDERSKKDSRIMSALQILTDMGFKNDNELLTRLLEHLDGDISKTLDRLTMQK